jgi:hypothetical protein
LAAWRGASGSARLKTGGRRGIRGPGVADPRTAQVTEADTPSDTIADHPLFALAQNG